MLSVNNFTSSYGQAPVIHEVSLEVGPGEVCVILGPNGAGKSTLLRTIMGIVPKVLSGTASVGNERSLDYLPTHAIASLGVAYVPEGRGILNSLTVLENLQLGMALLKRRYPQEDAASVTANVLDSFPMLKGRAQEPAGLLSGGQQQMLAIARALLSKPSVLLLDEPSLGLAPMVRIEVAGLLRRIADSERVAILLAEQDIALAQRCADRAYVLRRGRIVAQMSADELHDHDRLRELYLGAPEALPSAAD